MDLMQARRRVLIGEKKVIDTSPKIAEYGKMLNYERTGERSNIYFCITEWYPFDVGTVNLIYLYNKLYATQRRRDCNYQYYATNANGTLLRDWWFNTSEDDPRRQIGWNTFTLKEIRFSIPIKEIDDSFAYVKETGQIFFAGKNSLYYGYTNINDMP